MMTIKFAVSSAILHSYCLHDVTNRDDLYAVADLDPIGPLLCIIFGKCALLLGVKLLDSLVFSIY